MNNTDAVNTCQVPLMPQLRILIVHEYSNLHFRIFSLLLLLAHNVRTPFRGYMACLKQPQLAWGVQPAT